MNAIVEEMNRTDPPPPPAASEADIHYRPMLAGAALELCDLTKRLGSRPVLDGVNLAILKGETMTVIGGSGAGKSVLLKHIVGLMKPDRGCVKVNGTDISGGDRAALEAARRKIGFCFQGSALLNSLSVFENVALPLREH
ncbi:MAG TPA: ATP-binding cassette domain-containing protein, partial [Planctomycetota bacterium]|nr:ATP-binding cassette domain-containing protein [Planctomycetota bacterium]